MKEGQSAPATVPVLSTNILEDERPVEYPPEIRAESSSEDVHLSKKKKKKKILSFFRSRYVSTRKGFLCPIVYRE